MVNQLRISNLEISLAAGGSRVTALFQAPDDYTTVYVFAHGAGANMRHTFMEAVSGQLAQRGVATLRYNFPYMESGGKRPDSPKVLEATVRAAIDEAVKLAAGKIIIAGGKSMGGRMTSNALAKDHDARVRGIAFVGFPLHQPGKPSTDRAAHLADVRVPMLFLQGTRDTLARIDLIEQLCHSLGGRATLHIIPTADHSFAVLKSTGRSNDEVKAELASSIADWALTL
jgi:hypothetical protein